jgi:uncharacterized protein YbjT (DUF2867 family)
MPHHWQKMRVEEALIESRLPFTIIQPAAYMQNILVNWSSIASTGVYEVPYALDTRISMVDLEDVADAVAEIMIDEQHKNATYELAGPDALSQTEVSEIISIALGKNVEPRHISADDWKNRALKSGMPNSKVQTLEKMFAHYQEHEFIGNPNILNWILKRESNNFTAFVNRIAAEYSRDTSSH